MSCSQLFLNSMKFRAALLPCFRFMEVLDPALATSNMEGSSMMSSGKHREYGPMEVCPISLTVVTSAKGIGKKAAD